MITVLVCVISRAQLIFFMFEVKKRFCGFFLPLILLLLEEAIFHVRALLRRGPRDEVLRTAADSQRGTEPPHHQPGAWAWKQILPAQWNLRATAALDNILLVTSWDPELDWPLQDSSPSDTLWGIKYFWLELLIFETVKVYAAIYKTSQLWYRHFPYISRRYEMNRGCSSSRGRPSRQDLQSVINESLGP